MLFGLYIYKMKYESKYFTFTNSYTLWSNSYFRDLVPYNELSNVVLDFFEKSTIKIMNINNYDINNNIKQLQIITQNSKQQNQKTL